MTQLTRVFLFHSCCMVFMEKAKSEESNSEEQEDDSSSSTDEVEPKLKYERLSNDLQAILRKDAVSCVAFHPKIICIGTRWGLVHLLDHQGNTVHNEHLRPHTVAVNQISMDANGDFIATCSDDGNAYAYGLYTSEHVQELNNGRCVTSVAIDPLYHRLGTNRRFVTGDDRLMLHEKKSFPSRIKSTILYEAVGRVQNIKWQDRFIAWACDVGVRVFDIVSRTPLVLIKWNRSENIIPENYPCCLSWKDNITLLIGWVDTVRVCQIEKRNSIIRELPEFSVNPVSTFQIDYFVSGICPLDSSQLVILAYVKEKDEGGKALRPLMYILQAEDSKYVEVYTDNLSLRGFPDYVCNDYHFECLVDENRFIIASPKDVVVASIYDFDDRIEWLVEHDKFEEAMELVVTKERYLQRNNLLAIGRKYVDYLLSRKEFVKAAELCAKVLGSNKELWEIEVFKFAKAGQLRAVSQYLPIGPEYRLNKHIYEMVLYEYLKKEPKNFLKIVKEWPPSLYHVTAVINATLDHVVRHASIEEIRMESLAVLYTYAEEYEKALNIYLKLKHKDVFRLIQKHKLYKNIYTEIDNLMELDSSQAIVMLLDTKHIPPELVVSRLEHNQYFLYLYLDALEKKESKTVGKKYHTLLVKLYATWCQPKLLSLLKRSDSYPIQEALTICKERDLYPEMVYLLGRIGNTKEALQLLINKIGNMNEAIIFCKEHEDPELWEELAERSLSNPEFVKVLLEKIGSYVDPRILIQRIDDKMEIPELKAALVKMLQDYTLQVSIREGCKNIVVSDCFDLHKRLVRMQRSGICVDDNLLCSVCHQKVLIKNNNNNVLVFYCRHTFHEKCLPGSVEKCIICCTQKSGRPVT